MGLAEKRPEQQQDVQQDGAEALQPHQGGKHQVRSEVFLEYKKGDKRLKALRLTPKNKLFVIGSSLEADLRVLGDGAKGCHVALRYRHPHWFICDIGGEGGLKVDGKVVVEARLEKESKIEIGSHLIILKSKERDTEIFKESAVSSGTALHQVVVRFRGRVVDTKILPASEGFKFDDGNTVTTLPAPRDGQWVNNQIGPRLVQQRLIGAQEAADAEKLAIDQDLRKPFAIALGVFTFMLVTLLLIGSGKGKKEEVTLDKKSMDIIFNAKAVKKKKMESQKISKSARAKGGGTNSAANTPTAAVPEESTAPKAADKPSAAVTSLRKSGLSNLIGKIAKRANKQGMMVAAQGVSADTQGAGRAFFATGTTTTGGGGAAAKEGASFKLGGVGTKGRAGGTGDFKDGTALAGGNVGSGDIVAMVDDETVIEGGLDRDVIAEVIRRNLGQIRYCYERQLSSNPDLYGKILVKFTIGAGGEVSEQRVDNSTLKSAMVEGCIMRRMAAWKFPEPKGGTQVKVSYPFLFKAN